MKYPKDYFLTHEGEAHNFSQIKKICGNCQSLFMVQFYRKDTARFCSKICLHEGYKGSKLTDETKARMSENRRGEKHWNYGKKYSDELKLKLSLAHKGQKPSLETRKKLSESLKGELSSNWKGGITPLNKLLRRGLQYKLWREEVFKKDDWTCQECKIRGYKLHPHHIKQFAFYPELRFDTFNGVTLCEECHKKIPVRFR